MMDAIHALLREKAYHKQQFTMNVKMRYNCANISQRGV